MKKFLTVLSLFVAITISATAQTNWVNISSDTKKPAEIELISSDINNTTIQFTLKGYKQNTYRTPNGLEKAISIPDAVQIMEKGHPDLGKLVTTVIIPDLDQMVVNVVSYNYKEYNDIAVAPSKGHFDRNINPQDVPYVYKDVYDTDDFWPSEIATLDEPFIMRDFRGQVVTVFPFQYNPVSNTLRVYTDIVIEVSSSGNEGENPLVRKREEILLEPEFGKIYERFFINSATAKKDYPLLEGEEGSLLIICYDDFMEAMQPFVDWKRTTGRRTEIVPKSEAGTNPSEIKNFVQDYYDENDDFAHLLLVGDAPQIPPMTTSNGASDNAYGFLVGTNSYNDIFVGRFSAESVADVETQVQRMIEYERDINETDTWLSTGMGVARNEGTGSGHHGENDYQHMDFIKDTLLNFTYDVVHRRYDGNVPGVPNTNAAEISSDINDGVSIINFCNHGSVDGWSVAGYNISHVNQLTNVGKLPFIWSVACVNGAFVNALCFAEVWLRATHDGQPTGAIGMKAATINQPWQPPMCGQDEMNSILTEESIPHGSTIKRTYGAVSINGSMFMIPQHGTQGTRTHETWILFGDPTLMVRTDVPETISATYDPVIFLGLSQFDVSAPDADGAVVAVTIYDEIDEEVVILGTAVVEDGVANVHFDEPVSQPGMATLAITGFNKVTYLNEEINIIPPEGPYVTFNSYEIDDSAGNNNGVAEYGEYISLNMSLRNVGIETADGVEAVLNSESEYITITDNSHSWGSIDEGDDAMQVAAFSFKVDDVIPDNQNVLFNMIITDSDNNEWESNFSLRIYSPVFSIGEFYIDDSAQGDGNGRLDPGEVADIVVRYTNNGGAYAMDAVSQFIASSPYLTILDEVIEHDVILPGDYIEAAYTVEANASTPEGTLLDVLFSIEDAHYIESEQSLVIGQVPETIVGEGTDETQHYPFYNYYKANRSQVLYTVDELGQGEKTITEMGMDIRHITSTPEHQQLPNFKVKVKHTDLEQLSTSFVNMSDAVIIFEENPHQMPTEEVGWHIWDIENFEYDGSSNLIIEVVWGLLDTWCGFNDYYRVSGTTMPTTRAVFGYNDNNPVPDYNGNSNILPNLYLAFAAEETEEERDVNFLVRSIYGDLIEEAGVRVGSKTLYTDQQGKTSFTLMPGHYGYSATKEGYSEAVGFFDLIDSDISVTVILEGGTYVTDKETDEFNVKVFPNPTLNFVNVHVNSIDSEIGFILANYLGQVIEKKSVSNVEGLNELQFNLEGLSPGIYYLRVESGSNVKTEKIILQ